MIEILPIRDRYLVNFTAGSELIDKMSIALTCGNTSNTFSSVSGIRICHCVTDPQNWVPHQHKTPFRKVTQKCHFQRQRRNAQREHRTWESNFLITIAKLTNVDSSIVATVQKNKFWVVIPLRIFQPSSWVGLKYSFAYNSRAVLNLVTVGGL